MSGPILSFILLLFAAFQQAPSDGVQPTDEDPPVEEVQPNGQDSTATEQDEQTDPADPVPPEVRKVSAEGEQSEDQEVPAGAEQPQERVDPEQTGPQTPELVEVPIWPVSTRPAMEIVETDSTLRWLMALDWTERLSRIPGSVMYRTGSVGRPVGMHLDGFETRHQRLFLEQIELTDPVTGQVFWPRVPYHHIRTVESMRGSTRYETFIQLRDHYLVQPRTYLNFDEGAGNYRHLEFAFTHNLRPRTNLEFAFWDRRDGSNFRRSDLTGRQLLVRLRHHIGETWLLKGGYLNNGLDQQEPFGYRISDPELYGFNPFRTSPVEGSAAANRSSNDLYLQLFHRPVGRAEPVRAAGLQLQGSAYDLTYSRDTTAYSLQDLNLFAWQELQAGEAKVRIRGDAHLLREREARSLPGENWMEWEASARGEVPIGSRSGGELGGERAGRPAALLIYGNSGLKGRSDGHAGYELYAGVRWQPGRRLSWDVSVAQGASIPTLQSLYWRSVAFAGNEALRAEQTEQMISEMTYRVGASWEAGLRGGWRRSDRAGLLEEIPGGVDGTGEPLPSTWAFVEADPYETRFGSAWIGLDARHWEGEVSATVREMSSESSMPAVRSMMEGEPPLWLKGEMFWKGNVYSSAAYVKGGLRGMWSPGGYRPAQFHVPMNIWQSGGTGDFLGDFSRVDLEVSSRIRWFMLLIRYENLLDGVTQRGYFETDRYPMPGRRLIVSFRVVFTN